MWFCFVLFHFEEEAETASQTGNRHRKPAVRSAHALRTEWILILQLLSFLNIYLFV